MRTAQDIFGFTAEPNTTLVQPDVNDIAVDSAVNEKEFDMFTENIFKDISGGDPADLEIVSPRKQVFPELEPEDSFAISYLKTTGRGGLSLAGKGLSLASELFSRYNRMVTSLPIVQMQLGLPEESVKKLQSAIHKSAQWYAMSNRGGNMSRKEALDYADNLIGDKKDFEVSPKDTLTIISAAVNPMETLRWLNTAKRLVTPTPLGEEEKKEMPTFGQELGDKYYKTLTGKNPSNAWVGLVDFAFETLITTPVATARVVTKALKTARKGGEIIRVFPPHKLRPFEIKELRKYYARWGVSKLVKDPIAARSELKRLSGLSKYTSDAKLERALTIKAIDYQKELEVLIGRGMRQEIIISKEKVQAGRDILDSILSDVKPAQKMADAQKALSKAKKYRKAYTARDGSTGERAARHARWALKGDDFVHDFDVDLSHITQGMKDELFDVINALPEWDAQTASTGMWKILGKRLPARSEVAALEKAFGYGVLEKIEKLANRKLSFGEWLTDLANMPRAFQTSFDMGAPIRQGNFGLKAGYADDWANAFIKMLKAGGSQRYADDIDRIGKLGARAALYRESGLDLTTLSKFAKLTAREEQYLSTFAERIPLIGRAVRWSERVHLAFLNQFRMNIFDSVVTGWRSEGRILQPKDLKALAQYVNHVTGRGDLKTANKALRGIFGVFGKEIKDVKMPTTASAVLYSPRFMLSKVQVHTDLFATDSPLVRKLIARDLRNYYYTNVQILRLAKMGEQQFGWEVEDDPTSTEWGKIKVGNIRYDIWGPSAPLMRLVARIETGTSKSAVSKEIRDISRKEVLMRFTRSKASPLLGMTVDLIKGETFIGSEVDLTSAAGLGEIVYERNVPLVVQDLIDAFRFGDTGFLAKSMVSSAFFGEGVVSYRPTSYQQAYQKKVVLARELFGVEKLEDLTVTEKMALLKYASVDPEIQMLEREGMYERSDDMGEYIAAEQRAAEKEIKSKLPKNIRDVLDVTFAGILGVSRRIEFQGAQLELQREEYKTYKDLIAKRIRENLTPGLIIETPEYVDKTISDAIKQAQADMMILLLSQ